MYKRKAGVYEAVSFLFAPYKYMQDILVTYTI